MYMNTDIPHLYYKFNKSKVPTYGKIFKIIDFGRSIYRFNNRIFAVIVLTMMVMHHRNITVNLFIMKRKQE